MSTIRHPIACALAGTMLLGSLLAGTPADAQVDRYTELEYPAMPATEIPSPERHVLDNGMVVILLEDHELPLIEARAMIRTGSRLEPADHLGLAGLAGQVMREGGTSEMASEALDDWLEDRAATIETSIGLTSGSAQMSCLTGDFADVLAVFADVLRRPAFDADRLEVARTQTVSGIARQNDDASQILAREFNELIYGGDAPYARNPTYESVANVDREDLVDWHARYYHPERVVLGLVGDFDAAEALAEVRRVFGDWQRGSEPSAVEVSHRQTANPGVYFVEKSDVTQAYIRAGHLGIVKDDEDFYAVEVLNQVFGGAFSSRLFSKVRSELGLAYNVFGVIGSQWDFPGTFLMSMSTKTETTVAGVEALLAEVERLSAEPPTAPEVERAKSAILNSFVFNSDSTSKILAQQLTFEFFGYPLDWLARYRQGIEAVTVDEVHAAAAAHIHPDDFTILVVGPAEGTDRPLDALGEVTPVDITIPQPPQDEVELTAEGRTRGDELFAAAVVAHGGAERIDSVTNLAWTSTAQASTPQGDMSVGIEVAVVFPDRLQQKLALPMGTMVNTLNGDAGFQAMGAQSRPMPAGDVDELKKGLRRNLVALLQARDDGLEPVATSSEEIGGVTIEKVVIDVDGDRVTLAIDTASGRIVGLGYRGFGLTGAPGEIWHTYSDFREVDGLLLPFSDANTLDGNPRMTVAIEALTVNGEVDESQFALPTP